MALPPSHLAFTCNRKLAPLKAYTLFYIILFFEIDFKAVSYRIAYVLSLEKSPFHYSLCSHHHWWSIVIVSVCSHLEESRSIVHTNCYTFHILKITLLLSIIFTDLKIFMFSSYSTNQGPSGIHQIVIYSVYTLRRKKS